MNEFEFFKNHLAQTTPFPLGIEVDYARGSEIFETNGRRIIDMISGVAVTNIGHNHPHVVRAIKEQVDKHMHVMVYGEFVQSAQNKLGRILKEALPNTLNCSYLVNSGTEANEAAIKLAKRVSRRSKIVSCQKSYHGSTHGSLSISGNETKKSSFRPLLPDVYFIEFNSLADLDTIDDKTACVIIETVQGDAGVRIPSLGWIHALRKRCNEVGALLIFDEIQCGIGRTGSLFAFEKFKVVPDILTLGKALGGGMPIGAMIASTERMNALTHDPMLGHITTFGGHPVVAAAAAATLEVIDNEIDWNEVEAKGAYLEKGLKHPCVKEIRRIGLMFAIDLASEKVVQKVVDYCLSHGVLTFWFLSTAYSFRLSPPLNISYELLDEALEVIQEGFAQATS